MAKGSKKSKSNKHVGAERRFQKFLSEQNAKVKRNQQQQQQQGDTPPGQDKPTEGGTR